MAKPKKIGLEWIGGIVQMPAYVMGEGEPYRPEAMLWLNEDGLVLGVTTSKPGDSVAAASESLREAMSSPMVGKAHAPRRLRVASAELADAIRGGHPTLDIVIAPTPELQEVVEGMREHMGERRAQPDSMLAPDTTPEMMGSFFTAAAGLYRAKPWAVVPADEGVFSLTIEKLGLRNAALVFIGQMGESLGFILFSSLDDFDRFLDAASALEHGEKSPMPRHFALNFERGADLPPKLRKEVSKRRWEVAGAAAYPLLVAVDEDLVSRPPSAREVTVSEAICLALPQVLRQKEALDAAWTGEGPPVSSALTVKTHAGEVEVLVRAPHEPVLRRHPSEIMADLLELAETKQMHTELREALEDELLAAFEDSPECNALPEVGFAPLLMNYAASVFDATIATLAANELREVLFDIVPQEVSIEAGAAGSIVAELRAFYTFLQRESGLEQAPACLRVLDRGSVKKLAGALSNTSHFGMAKSLIMAGAEAGFDMSTEAGLNAWMQVVSSKPLPDSFRLPLGAPAQARSGSSSKKKAPKAARKPRGK